MNVFILQNLTVLMASYQILVKYGYSQKVGSWTKLKADTNLNHPVDHFSSIFFSDFMTQ